MIIHFKYLSDIYCVHLDSEKCYLLINLANNGLLIFWNFVELCFNKIPEKSSGTEPNIHDRDFLQKYLTVLTVNHFHKMLHHWHLNGSLIRLSESKLKCCFAKFEDSKIASYSFHSTIVTSWYIAKDISNFKSYH